MTTRLILLASLLPLLPVAGAPGKPNFLVIVADDMCWRDLGCQGHPDVKSPNIDRLAAGGIRLDGFFSSAATCSPLRHALYTGLYPVRSGAYPNHTRVREGTRSIFTHLAGLGYRVALQNKQHVGPPASFPYRHIEGADDLTETAAFVRADRPWLLVFASNDPHSPWNRGPKRLYDPAKITVPPYLHDNGETRRALAAYFAEISKLDRQVGALLGLLEQTGQADDTVVLFVSEQGCSLPYGGKWSLYDTGGRVSAVLRWPGVVEPGSRSRALIQYVDVAPTLVEIAGGDPAAVDTGCPDAEGNRGFDGRSFLGVLKGSTDRHRDHVFAQHTTVGVHGFREPYPSRMVRDRRFKLIRNLAPDNTFWIRGIHENKVFKSWQRDAENDPALAARVEHLMHRPAVELYDLTDDPFEQRNLADDPDHAGDRDRLGRLLDDWMARQGDRGLETEKLAPTRQGRAKDRPEKPARQPGRS